MSSSLILINPAVLEVAELIQNTLVQGYLTHHAAMIVARDPRAPALAPLIERGQIVPVGRVPHRGDEGWTYHFLHHLELARNDAGISDEMDRVWIYGALLLAADALLKHSYFDRAPELEMIRHLRNGIAHGNKFRLDKPQQLAR